MVQRGSANEVTRTPLHWFQLDKYAGASSAELTTRFICSTLQNK